MTQRRGPRPWDLITVFGAVALIVLLATQQAGCAAGRAPGGEIVVGVPVASLPESAGDFLGAAANVLPAPWNWIAGAGATLLVGGPLAANARNAARRREAEREAATLAGRESGWDAALRESPRVPVPVVVPADVSGGGAAVPGRQA